MKWISFVFVLTCFFSVQSALAFSGKRCAKVYPGGSGGLGKVEKMYYALASASTSTSQFLSSTGHCRMIGGVSEEEKKQFVAHNSDHLKKNIIRAEGDYLSAMVFLYGCDDRVTERVSLKLQEKTIKIFGEDLSNNAETVSNQIDAIMLNDLEIKKICTLG